MPNVLKLPNFRRLFLSGFFSEMGSFITETALMLFVFQISGQNKAYLGITRAAFLTFLTLGSILGGPLGQKYNRKKILIFSNLCRIPLMISLIFSSHLILIIAVNSLIAFFTGLYNPSRHTMVNDLVPPKDIPSANSIFSSTMAILHIVGPFVGAFAFTYFNGITEVLSFDLFTYFIGVFLLMKINYHPPKNINENIEEHNFFTEINNALKLVLKRLDLISLYLNCIVGGLCIGVLIPLLLPFVTEVLHQGQRQYGILLSIFGLGGIVGAISSSKLSQYLKPGKIVTYCICLEAIIMNVWIQVHHYYFSLIVIFIWGVFVFLRLPSQLNYLSLTVETKFLTRAHSLLDLSFVIPNIAGGIFIGYLGNSFTAQKLLEIVGIAFLIMTIPRFFLKEMKALNNSSLEQVSRDEAAQDKTI
ncbi:MAG: MFS transporter [Bacteriovoracaceae bacterium]|nr:MFS transporter [Bacteriovoracaceae bacterium]